ncbi:MAG: selenocysteine-specific translation elongation factor [Phycisphaerales bacterium]
MQAPTLHILGTAGHIDHGKTALVRALTGVDTDRLPEEKSRGITIDLGFAELDLGESCTLGVVDVPGHERFIRNMLAGASGIDIAMLVVAADDGIMPQTREHLAILQLLDLRGGVIVLTKCDLAEDAWIDLVEDDVRALVQDTFLADAPLVRTSAAKGVGIDALRDVLRELARNMPKREVSRDRFRLAVDRAFAGQGVGTIVTGTVTSGSLGVDDRIEWLPRREIVRIRSMQTHGQSVDRIQRGQRAAINLLGVHHADIRRGDELVAPGWLYPTRLLAVSLHVLHASPFAVRHRARIRLHIGTQEVMAAARLLERSTAINPGEHGWALLLLAEPAVASEGQPFVVRAESPLRTLGGGHVLVVNPPRIRRGNAEALAALRDLESGDEAARLRSAFYFADGAQLNDEECADRARLMNVEQVPELIQACVQQKQLVAMQDSGSKRVIVQAAVFAVLRKRALQVVQRLHDQSPLSSTIPIANVEQALIGIAPELRQPLIATLIKQRDLVSDASGGGSGGVARADFSPRISEQQQSMLKDVIATYRLAGYSPPDLAAIAQQLGVADRAARAVLDLAVELGELLHLGGPLYMHAAHEAAMRNVVQRAFATKAELTVADIRDALGTSRKFAVPLCEYLDRVKVTRRVGDVRQRGSAIE